MDIKIFFSKKKNVLSVWEKKLISNRPKSNKTDSKIPELTDKPPDSERKGINQ